MSKMDANKFADVIKLAKKQCGIDFDLKEKQLKCMEAVVKGQDCIGILPTGYGKSLIYSLLPALLDHYYDYSTSDASIEYYNGSTDTEVFHYFTLISVCLTVLKQLMFARLHTSPSPASHIAHVALYINKCTWPR